MQLRKETSAERRKMTVFQGIFRSEGTRDGRGQQQHRHLPVAAARYGNKKPDFLEKPGFFDNQSKVSTLQGLSSKLLLLLVSHFLNTELDATSRIQVQYFNHHVLTFGEIFVDILNPLLGNL